MRLSFFFGPGRSIRQLEFLPGANIFVSPTHRFLSTVVGLAGGGRACVRRRRRPKAGGGGGSIDLWVLFGRRFVKRLT